METQKPPIERACALLGSQSALAALLKVTAPTVNQWTKGFRPVPAERCIEIERSTSGRVTCEELRPDVDWAYIRNQPKRKSKPELVKAA